MIAQEPIRATYLEAEVAQRMRRDHQDTLCLAAPFHV